MYSADNAGPNAVPCNPYTMLVMVIRERNQPNETIICKSEMTYYRFIVALLVFDDDDRCIHICVAYTIQAILYTRFRASSRLFCQLARTRQFLDETDVSAIAANFHAKHLRLGQKDEKTVLVV